MREVIKMIFFRSIFAFGLVVAIRLLIFHIEEKMGNIEKEIDEICEKKYKEEKKRYELRIKMMEKMCEERINDWYNIRIKYYEILSFQICGKSVEEWMKDKDKWISETIYIKKNKSSGKK